MSETLSQVVARLLNRASFFESMLSPHKHVLTLGLPAFCQCRTYLASRETVVFLVMWEACMSDIVGQFSWLTCARTQVHMSPRLLFTYVCCDMLQQDRGQRPSAHACSVLRGSQHCFLDGEVCDDYIRALVNYIVSDPFEPSMHHSAFMRFRVWSWHFAPSSLAAVYLLIRLSWEDRLPWYLQLR